jgi:hypothetical protein
MTARQGLLAASLALALALISPSPARAAWVECESDAPGRLTVGVILNPDQESIDPAVATLVWRTVGPTERVFYRGPLLNFGATIEGLAAGRYSIAYEYRGPEGEDARSFCSLEVAGTPSDAPGAAVATTPPIATPRPAATPVPAPAQSPSLEPAAAAVTVPPDSTAPLSSTPDATPFAEQALAPEPPGALAAFDPTPTGLALVVAGLFIGALALRRRAG